MALKGGTLDPEYYSGFYTSSLAQAIEEAFKEEWPNVMGSAVLKSNPQMQLLFVAIAKGIVRHLENNADAFKVIVSQDGSSFNTNVKIEITEPPLA